MIPAETGLGPLPRADGSAELQRRSFRAFRALFNDQDWLVRDERVDDLGVDVSLELLVAGQGTNFRSHVQLKGRTNVRTNQDGSLSVPVPVANLNYLLNGISPVYVLFRPEANDLFYAFARDEMRRIESASPDWKSQTDVTVRFTERLDAAAIGGVRERILREAQSNRRLHDIARTLAPGSHVPVDAKTLEPQSPADIERLLLEVGMTACARGFGNKVLEMCAMLPMSRFAAQPKLLLVRGYAEFTNGRYLQADAPLREAFASGANLSEDDRQFLQFLLNTIELALGNVSNETYRERSERWRTSASPVLAAQYDILHHWTLRAEAQREDEIRKHDEGLQEAITRLESLPDVSGFLLDYAVALRLITEAQNWCLRFVDVVAASSDPRLWLARFTELPSVVINRELQFVPAWQKKIAAAVQKIGEAADLPRYCELQQSRDACEEMILGYFYLASAMFSEPSVTVPNGLLERVRANRKFAREHRQYEAELRGGLVESDLEDLQGNTAASRRVAQDVFERADALRFSSIARIAKRTLDEGGMHSVRRREIEAARAGGSDGILLNMAEDELEANAREAVQMLRLPPTRLAVALDDLKCHIAAAKERLNWCRHLVVHERTPNDPSQYYARPPQRSCYCEKLGCRSRIPGTDWLTLISAFKATYCKSCAERAPRAVSVPTPNQPAVR